MGAVIGFILYLFLVPGLLFTMAGTTDWPMAWVYVILFLFSILLSRLIVLIRNPDTLRERARFTSTENVKSWDRVLASFVGLIGPALIVIVAGLDFRFKWPDHFPSSIEVAAACVLAAGYGLAVWAMLVNPFFSSVARIQDDRDHRVIRAGPYRFIRHPSYAGAVIAALAFPCMLDALASILPSMLLIVALVMRTSWEDQMLREELHGYDRYASETRYRLIPGIW